MTQFSGTEPWTRVLFRAAARWRGMTLARQFVIAGTVVVCAGMFTLGSWVSHKIENGVVQNTAAATAIYMGSVVEPVLQELADRPDLKPSSIEQLESLLASSSLGQRIASVKIWDLKGRIVFSKDLDLIGKTFPISDELATAYSGQISAELNHLGDAENENERRLNRQLLEIYIPLHRLGSDQIIAVGELYASADELESDIWEATRQSWMIVLAVTLAMLGALFLIVLRGSRTIEQQRAAARERVDELSKLLRRNEELRASVSESRRFAADTNERLLRRLGAELHDGPCQLIGLALLRLDALVPQLKERPDDPSDEPEDVAIIRMVLRDSLEDIRNLSAGIAPPELEGMSMAQTLEIAARNHERRTGTMVTLDIGSLPDIANPFLKTCIYRFAQEGLNNAFRHADAMDQVVRAAVSDGELTVDVLDGGPGLANPRRRDGNTGLGLAGLRARVESIGGVMSLANRPGAGTRLSVVFRLSESELSHA